jgi:hypothetical protein
MECDNCRWAESKEYGERDQNQSHVVNLSEESRVPSYAKQRCRTGQF